MKVGVFGKEKKLTMFGVFENDFVRQLREYGVEPGKGFVLVGNGYRGVDLYMGGARLTRGLEQIEIEKRVAKPLNISGELRFDQGRPKFEYGDEVTECLLRALSRYLGFELIRGKQLPEKGS